MLDGLSVVCSRETAVTRAEAESEKSEPVDGGGIEAVVVSAKRPVNHIKYERSDTDPVKPTEEDRALRAAVAAVAVPPLIREVRPTPVIGKMKI